VQVNSLLAAFLWECVLAKNFRVENPPIRRRRKIKWIERFSLYLCCTIYLRKQLKKTFAVVTKKSLLLTPQCLPEAMWTRWCTSRWNHGRLVDLYTECFDRLASWQVTDCKFENLFTKVESVARIMRNEAPNCRRKGFSSSFCSRLTSIERSSGVKQWCYVVLLLIKTIMFMTNNPMVYQVRKSITTHPVKFKNGVITFTRVKVCTSVAYGNKIKSRIQHSWTLESIESIVKLFKFAFVQTGWKWKRENMDAYRSGFIGGMGWS
jgi:hypothetical protein